MTTRAQAASHLECEPTWWNAGIVVMVDTIEVIDIGSFPSATLIIEANTFGIDE
jgi:hypothetical protein